jgi:hypothetical protein
VAVDNQESACEQRANNLKSPTLTMSNKIRPCSPKQMHFLNVPVRGACALTSDKVEGQENKNKCIWWTQGEMQGGMHDGMQNGMHGEMHGAMQGGIQDETQVGMQGMQSGMLGGMHCGVQDAEVECKVD